MVQMCHTSERTVPTRSRPPELKPNTINEGDAVHIHAHGQCEGHPEKFCDGTFSHAVESSRKMWTAFEFPGQIVRGSCVIRDVFENVLGKVHWR